MGEVRATLRVENTLDASKPGREVDSLVDTGAVMPMLPKDVLDELGISVIDRVLVTLANEQSEEMDVAGPITLGIGNRKMFGSCLVGAAESEPLIGQLVLESLDLIVDCPRNALRPRPESPGCPSYKLKWLLLDSGLMADLCNYTSGIDMDERMFGGEHRGRTQGSPLRSPRT
uniref:Clan AA aspartic protease, AF_0612 family n=1 Tax=Candidatus Kentrum sp. FM TaxID=2126340 RepID=A0A450TAU2_9GAMM|nr:MAG: hypothetical protein BECKFM1743A_GA0114220_103405 [Candidatus Kentron sp. FM]VFJ65907.1 MAG: hypothetical protein BECKFM1743C_GA0114222_104063 [Candidatus Kentron sp. FM]VFK14890.1 MAG: hypothetical protein BECKFM1743B_GA0114221_103445 [Candidatus Kentron sp. FM]